MSIVAISALVLAGTGLLLGVIIAVAAKVFFVKKDELTEAIAALLPGANCGGCGTAGCADFAKQLAAGKAAPSKCAACSGENRKKIAELLGQNAGESVKMTAVVLCSGSLSNARKIAGYNGVSDCRTASIVAGGGKGCRFGCLGYGTCARACSFGAIEIIDGLAVVHPEICRGCGKCTAVCPRKLIKLVPANAPVHVYCNSLQKPAIKRKFCKAMCLACQKCVRTEPEKMQSQGTLVRVDYGNMPDVSLIERAKCPTGALRTPEEHLKFIRESAKKGTEK